MKKKILMAALVCVSMLFAAALAAQDAGDASGGTGTGAKAATPKTAQAKKTTKSAAAKEAAAPAQADESPVPQEEAPAAAPAAQDAGDASAEAGAEVNAAAPAADVPAAAPGTATLPPVSETPPPAQADESPVPQEESVAAALTFPPYYSGTIWSMGEDLASRQNGNISFDGLELAKNPGDTVEPGKTRPSPIGVYFGVPPKSTQNVISLGTIGTDVDRFLSTTSFKDTTYRSTFGYMQLDPDSLSAGVSKKFQNGAVTSLYYNGNIIEDIFAYMSNNPKPNGAMSATDGAYGTSYDWLGEFKNGDTLDSRNNIELMAGLGLIGISVGYSQRLTGIAQRSTTYETIKDPASPSYQLAVNEGQQALLDNAMAPHVEIGFPLGKNSGLAAKLAIGLQVDFHQHRELFSGTETIAETGGAAPGISITGITDKLSGDYVEPAASFRVEVDFPSDERSKLGLSLETGFRMKFYGNTDDKAGSVSGIYWSEVITDAQTGLPDKIRYSVTETLDLETRLRPSVRYVTKIGERLKVGLNGGFGVKLKFGNKKTKEYRKPDPDNPGEYLLWDYEDYLAEDDPYNENNVYKTTTEVPDIDLALVPNLGVGFSFDIIKDTFSLNGGIGGVQTLYQIRSGKQDIDRLVPDPDYPGLTKTETTTVPFLEQSWGKPVAQLALGAAFTFKENYTIDALFSSNGTAFDESNFVVSFSARF